MMRRASVHRPFAALALLMVAAPVCAQSGLILPGTLGGLTSSATGVSADGTVVVGRAYAAGNATIDTFRWTQAGGMVSLGAPPGGTHSYAHGISADGAVVVGSIYTLSNHDHAFRWTQAGGMVDLGTLGGSHSYAKGASADGAVVVGHSRPSSNDRYFAFRWTQAGGMVSLGTLGGNSSYGYGISADGSVVVGYSLTANDGPQHAFRWTQAGGMVDLGDLEGGGYSEAHGISANGTVVVGSSSASFGDKAFRWTQAGGMVSLGTLGGTSSNALAVSGDGRVVVGESRFAVGNSTTRAFRWSQATGMQSVEDWLRASGVAVPADITTRANATSNDGSVVVGDLDSGEAFIARGSSGLVTLSDVQNSLAGTARGGAMALTAASTLLHGAHSRPLARRVAAGSKTFWLAGDWGVDQHGSRNGHLGLAELGVGQNLHWAQVNISLGQTWAQQAQVMNSRTKMDGTYILAEVLMPVSGNLWATLGGFGHWGRSDLNRSYLNVGALNYSSGTPQTDTWGLRARLDWDDALRAAETRLTPYVDFSYSKAKLDGYTETGGGFPARFDARTDNATELRLGVNVVRPLTGTMNLVATLEAAHRFEKHSSRTSGEIVGLFGFDLEGGSSKRDWGRAGLGVEGKLGGGTASLMLNATTHGPSLNTWLAMGWQKPF